MRGAEAIFLWNDARRSRRSIPYLAEILRSDMSRPRRTRGFASWSETDEIGYAYKLLYRTHLNTYYQKTHNLFQTHRNIRKTHIFSKDIFLTLIEERKEGRKDGRTEGREGREGREAREARDPRDPTNPRDPRDPRDQSLESLGSLGSLGSLFFLGSLGRDPRD